MVKKSLYNKNLKKNIKRKKGELEEELKEYLENISKRKYSWFLPLAKWYLTVPKSSRL